MESTTTTTTKAANFNSGPTLQFNDKTSSSSINNSKSSISRRSVDWRDSGIVIDEDQHFTHSIEGICYDNNSICSIGSNSIRNFNNSNRQLKIDSTSSIASSSSCWITHFEQDDDGDTILHLAVVGFTLDKVKDLIKIHDLNAINNMMQTPIHVATMANRPEMVQLLIAAGAKLNVHDRRGNTPLHLACQKGFKQIANIILEAIRKQQDTIASSYSSIRQHLEMTNFDGQTCLHLAATYNWYEIIALLVNDYNADINCQDSRSGETIMHKAICKFNVDLVEFITNLSKHCNRADYSGKRPLDTIKVLRKSKIDSFQLDKLNFIDRMVENRIRICIEHNGDGCCSLAQITQSPDNEILDSSSPSSSDYSDSDSDMSEQ